jgi:hypothetical protein
VAITLHAADSVTLSNFQLASLRPTDFAFV